MQKLFFLFSFLLVWVCKIHSQGIDRLDERNGFDKFKLEKSLDSYRSACKFQQKNSMNNTDEYKYLGKDIQKVFNLKVQTVTLSFWKSKLAKIQISFDINGLNYASYQNVLENLERIYDSGKPSFFTGMSDYLGHVWTGKKVQLILSGMKESSNSEKLSSLTISITSLDLMNETRNSGF